MKKVTTPGPFPEWHSMPLRLTKNEIEKPSEVLVPFISSHDLPSVRQSLQSLIDQVCRCNPADALRHIEFKQDLERFIEASYISQEKASTIPDLREYLAIIGHEIQNQLAGSDGILSTIESFKDESDYARRIEPYLGLLKLAMINGQSVYKNMQITAKAAITGVKIVPNITTFTPSTFFNGLLEEFKAIHHLKDNKLDFTVSVYDDFEGKTDTDMLRQIFVNLLLNALKYTRPKAAITVYVSQRSRNDLYFKVASISQKINQELKLKVFEPYFVIDKGKAGTGLGLHICKLYATALGGDIKIRSESRGSSSFIVTIPMI